MSLRINEHTAKNQYAAYALGASRAEQRGDYAEAESLWHKAAAAPCSALRRQWALARAEFCNSARLKGWRPRDECCGVK